MRNINVCNVFDEKGALSSEQKNKNNSNNRLISRMLKCIHFAIASETREGLTHYLHKHTRTHIHICTSTHSG